MSAEPLEEKTDDGDEYGYTLGKSADIRLPSWENLKLSYANNKEAVWSAPLLFAA